MFFNKGQTKFYSYTQYYLVGPHVKKYFSAFNEDLESFKTYFSNWLWLHGNNIDNVSSIKLNGTGKYALKKPKK